MESSPELSSEEVVILRNATIYREEVPVLTDVTLNVHRGEFVYLVGRTGAGKTSLLKTIYGELPLREGEGYVAGFDLRRLRWWRLPELRRHLGIIFQDFILLADRTVLDNLLFVMRVTGIIPRKKQKERAMHLLEVVNLHTKAHKMPFQLSGGEQQRLAIARALVNNPDIILADEPTGNLDMDTGREIVTLLHRINKEEQVTILMSTHNPAWIRDFPARTIHLANGKVHPHHPLQ